MLGNEAIARGAYEAGVKVSSAYPGTPSTEISEYLVQYRDDVYEEWAPNEKVATEVAVGASIAGVRSMACMKHVGLNVAADPLYSVSYMGVNGGLVLVVADDPGLYSSQNEQDTRMVARAAQIPVIEPSDSAEAKDYILWVGQHLKSQVAEALYTYCWFDKDDEATNLRILGGYPYDRATPNVKDLACYGTWPNVAWVNIKLPGLTIAGQTFNDEWTVKKDYGIPYRCIRDKAGWE